MAIDRRTRRLPLHEEVMLLALRNDRGTMAGGVMFAQAAGGAMLAELLLQGRLKAVTEGRSTRVELVDRTSTGDALLDEALEKVAAAADAGRRARAVTWVQRFARMRGLRHRVAERLVDRGILRADEATILLFFTRRIYPELDPTAERRIVERLDAAIFSDASDVDPRTTVLVALAFHTGLLKANLDRARLKARRTRIRAIIDGNVAGSATKAAVEAVQVAVLVAATMPAVVAATHTH
ncbi:MAG: GPP34 family phosphoprotein [Vicinamibacterales bacterium]